MSEQVQSITVPQARSGHPTRVDGVLRQASILVLRAALAVVFIAHGSQKLFGALGGGGISGTAEYMASLGATPGTVWAIVSGVIEFGGGIAVGIGLATRPAALALAANMVGAVVLTNWDNGFFSEKASGGWEINLILFSMALSVMLTGAGALSLDRLVAGRFEHRD